MSAVYQWERITPQPGSIFSLILDDSSTQVVSVLNDEIIKRDHIVLINWEFFEWI